ncbi:type VII secretion-associated serine protease mycosin [Micromonospora sp. WMMD961]|uniref:type VII secretion-associated serine protease mycosin n=1 Tax=Micromonospora sp. WMMD961 TaxID=3016100 RepID=UPI0024165628|nr:type VII secretion-associated serine protease mycosin [Micromonospora sp. WMMD961]MDG4779177.1 type VII secretion-associated serine protease mycosin [Micromonospora sp. WMMD961]
MPLPAAAPSNPSPTGVERVRQDQWHLGYLNATQAQRINKGRGVIVAVPDTGVAPHPDLSENLLAGTDIIADGRDDGQQDQNSHGTGMAGIIAAHGRPGNIGALGIAPESRILPIRTSRTDQDGDSDHLAIAIEYAIAQGAAVVSISSVAGPSTRLQRAVEAAVQANVIVIAGAGNKPRDTFVRFPAAYPGVVAVGGIDRNGNRAAISVTGPEIDVVAPAVDIYSTSLDGKYRKGTGTSDATAIVAGAAALIRSKYPYLPAREVAHRLTATAIDKGPPGRDDEYGYGVIDLVAALTADVPPLGFESVSAPAGAGPSTTAAGRRPDDDGSGASARGLATLGVIVAAGVAWAVVARRRRRSDDPPPRISR